MNTEMTLHEPASPQDHARSVPLTYALVPLEACRNDALWRRLVRDWRRLARHEAPLLDPALVAAQLPIARRGEPLLAIVRRGARVCAVLPLVRRGRRLLALRSDHGAVWDALGDAASLRALARGLVAEDGWDVMRLDDVPERSLLATLFVAEARHAGLRVEVRPAGRSPIFAIPGFESRLKAKHRANLRRLEKKAGGVEYERVTAADSGALAEGFAIEAMAWKGAEGTAITSDPYVEHFYRSLADLSALRGELSLSFLRVGGRRVAFLFGIEHAGVLQALKIGHDPTVAELGVGHLLVWKAAADAERRGLEVFDFMGKPDEWKRRWTDETRGSATLYVYRPSLRGIAEYALREIVKPHAPRTVRAVAQALVARVR